MRDLKIRLDQHNHITLHPGVLERMENVVVRVNQPENSRNPDKTFDIKFDVDGLLTVRGDGDDSRRYTPVLTADNKWVSRDSTGVREIELDKAAIPDIVTREKANGRHRSPSAKKRQAERIRQMGCLPRPGAGEVAE
jgi:hypothetical protein